MFKHGIGVEDKMAKILLYNACYCSNNDTCVKFDLPLLKFQEGVESTAVCQAVTLLVHQLGLCLLLTSYNSKNMLEAIDNQI